MTPLSPCEQLLEMTAPEDALIEAAATPECLELLLTTAREQMGANPAEAERRARLAVRLAALRRDLQTEAQAWRIIGQAQRVQGNHAGAVTSLETAAARATQAGDTPLALQSQTGLIDSLGWLGRYDAALKLARRLETEFRAQNALGDAAKVLVNRGALHYRRDQYAAALACYDRAIEAFAESGDTVAQAKLQSNTAAVLMELHRTDEAIALFEQARASFAANDLPVAAAMVDANVGFLYYLSGRHALCVTAFQRAREEFVQRGFALETFKCDADMAEAYRELNLHPEALDAYARAIDAPESLPLTYERARAEMGRAAVWMATGQSADAFAGLERAASLFRARRNATQTARVRLLRARLLREEGQDAEARTEARKAAAALQRRGLRGWAAEARFLCAEIDSDAEQDVTRSLHSIRRAARAASRGWLECRAERALGQAALRQGQIGRGLRHLRASVQALEAARTLIAPEEMHVSFLSDKQPVYEEIVGALLARGSHRDIAEALEYVERAKSRLLLERLQSALEGRFAARRLPPETQARLEHLRAELSRGYFRLNALDEGESRRVGTADAADIQKLNALEQAYRAALQEAEGSLETLPALPAIVPAEALQRALRTDENLLVYYIVAGTVCAWIITPSDVQFQRDIARLDEVQAAARRLRYQLQQMQWGGEMALRQANRFQAGAQDALRRLYDLLLRPIADRLVSKKVILIPHGDLHSLPFHAFFEGACHALDRWEFVVAPSAAIWQARARNRSERADTTETLSDAALLFGIPAPGIAHVTEEIARLTELLPKGRVFTEEAATLEAFRTHAPHCRLLHLATHALYREDNPLFSGLQMADGWLLARDLYETTLDCDLVTLSACQTGVALVEAGDELFGLVRGFLAAGARSVAASLWPADDRATVFLMEHFYTRLTQGESRAAALRAAQQATRRRYPHPYHWAAFVLVGEN